MVGPPLWTRLKYLNIWMNCHDIFYRRAQSPPTMNPNDFSSDFSSSSTIQLTFVTVSKISRKLLDRLSLNLVHTFNVSLRMNCDSWWFLDFLSSVYVLFNSSWLITPNAYKIYDIPTLNIVAHSRVRVCWLGCKHKLQVHISMFPSGCLQAWLAGLQQQSTKFLIIQVCIEHFTLYCLLTKNTHHLFFPAKYYKIRIYTTIVVSE